VPLAIVPAPMAPAERPEYEGLDARDALPPLLRPGMLMDLEGYGAWERHVIALLASGTCGPAASVARLARDAVVLSSWTPSQGPLRAAVERLDLPARSEPSGAAEPTFRASVAERYAAVIAAVPAALRPAALPPLWASHAAALVDPGWDTQAEPLRRYLAGRAFASWVAWQGGGLTDVVESLWMALAVVYAEAARGCGTTGRELDQALLFEAIRRADDLLVHRASPARLARAASASPRRRNGSFGWGGRYRVDRACGC
jgi:hypothetical protein